jgi:hypothetical protein
LIKNVGVPGWLMVDADPEVLPADLDPEWRALVIDA